MRNHFHGSNPIFSEFKVVEKMYILVHVIGIINIEWNYKYQINGHWRANKDSKGNKQQKNKPFNRI